MKTSSILPLVTAVALSFGAAHAATIYQELFTNITGSKAAISTVGWTAYNTTGTNLSGSVLDPLSIFQSGDRVFIGSSSVGGQYALLSDAGSIDPTGYDTDLTITISQSAAATVTLGANVGWRALAQVGSTIYATDFTQSTTTTSSLNWVISSAIWHVWTGETDLTNGFNTANISGTAVSAVGGFSHRNRCPRN